jgi:hypothetical protein
MPCDLCQRRGEVLIGPGGKIVWRREEAIARMPCPAGCIGGDLRCCDGACGGPREITNEGGK